MVNSNADLKEKEVGNRSLCRVVGLVFKHGGTPHVKIKYEWKVNKIYVDDVDHIVWEHWEAE